MYMYMLGKFLSLRPSSYATEITRILERCIKESRAVDTETLCIIAGEKVSSALLKDTIFYNDTLRPN